MVFKVSAVSVHLAMRDVTVRQKRMNAALTLVYMGLARIWIMTIVAHAVLVMWEETVLYYQVQVAMFAHQITADMVQHAFSLLMATANVNVQLDTLVDSVKLILTSVSHHRVKMEDHVLIL